jgi:cytoskeletal protein RodZ
MVTWHPIIGSVERKAARDRHGDRNFCGARHPRHVIQHYYESAISVDNITTGTDSSGPRFLRLQIREPILSDANVEPQPQVTPGTKAEDRAPAARPWFKKKRIIIPAALAGLLIIVSAANAGGGSDSPDAATSTQETEVVDNTENDDVATEAEAAAAAEAEAAAAAAAAEAEAAAAETVSQSNARGSAESYLRVSAFSRSGLIGQLEFEGFSTADAEYGVDANDVDWLEQAAKSAENYLNVSSFSRSGLIDQLIFEGFSPAEAEHGVTQTGL